jgi:nucleotide-binding universal stress UspA family protein
MTAVREVLVATDFSEQGEAAVALAALYARRFGARVHVLHVLMPGDTDVTRLLADAAASMGPDLPVVVASEAGEPGDVIVRHAKRHAIDLIVVGTHARRGMSRMLLGSVATRVLQTAPCPVLAVPPPRAEPERR